MNKIVDCVYIANKILEECKQKVELYNRAGVGIPNLLIVENEDDEASKVYVRNKAKACEKIGIKCDVASYVTPTMMKEYDRVIIQLPTDKPHLLPFVTPLQDVDGLSSYNVGNLHLGDYTFHQPCTPRGIMTMLKHERYDLDGKHVVIVGRSNIVGRPLVAMMEQANATVTLCHSHTRNLKDITKQADVLVVAIGKPKFITREYIKEGAFVIDVGINRDENGKLCGDVDMDNVYDKVGKITPVPNGVGKLTVATLIQNILDF